MQAHQDGPAYWPGVCIVSLGAAAVMRFRSKAIGAGGGKPQVCGSRTALHYSEAAGWRATRRVVS